MDLEKFREELKQEMLAGMRGDKTPILDRFQAHLDNVGGNKYKMDHLLNLDLLASDLWVSMLHQIIYPAKKKNILRIYLNGKEIEGKTIRNKIQNLVIKVGVDVVKQLKIHSKFLYKKDIGEVVGNAYKVVDENHSFDTSFGGVGASSVGVYFIKELQSIGIDIKLENYETYSYS